MGKKSRLRMLVPRLGLIVVFVATLMAACTPYPPPMTATPMLNGTALPTFTPGPSPTQRPTITPFPSPTVAPVRPPGPGGEATPFLGE